jgi:hypothetical protein
MFKDKTRLVAFGAAAFVAIAVVGGAGVVVATSGDDDKPLTGTALERATEAALAHTGGGTVIETEEGDEGAAYGVEVKLENGSVVEVSLDADFNVIGEEQDDDGADGEEDDDGSGDDG